MDTTAKGRMTPTTTANKTRSPVIPVNKGVQAVERMATRKATKGSIKDEDTTKKKPINSPRI
jgi:hypothetical protein